MENKKRTFKPRVETKLTREDFKKVDDLAMMENKTKSEVVRDAVLWYLENQEQVRNEERETVTAKSIDAMANRVCAMLARQGRLIATLFELTYSNMSQTEAGKEAFNTALAKAKQKMAKNVEQDERQVVEAMKKALKS